MLFNNLYSLFILESNTWFDPTKGTQPVSRHQKIRALHLEVSDHPVILKVKQSQNE